MDVDHHQRDEFVRKRRRASVDLYGDGSSHGVSQSVELNLTPEAKDTVSPEDESGSKDSTESIVVPGTNAHSPQPDEGRDGSDDSATVCADPEPPSKRRKTGSGSAIADDSCAMRVKPEPGLVPRSAHITTVTFTIDVKRESRSQSPSWALAPPSRSLSPAGIDPPIEASSRLTPSAESLEPASSGSASTSQADRRTTPAPTSEATASLSGSPARGTDIQQLFARLSTPPNAPEIFMLSVPPSPLDDLEFSGSMICQWPEVEDFATFTLAETGTQELIDRYLGAVESALLPLMNG
ncbi:hypothetical protein B0H11DRAFT_2121814 [Mycena galericulata]|nr:hypothetical protein B0H11DRAFT_2121814 [Mycena galericulata]